MADGICGEERGENGQEKGAIRKGEGEEGEEFEDSENGQGV